MKNGTLVATAKTAKGLDRSARLVDYSTADTVRWQVLLQKQPRKGSMHDEDGGSLGTLEFKKDSKNAQEAYAAMWYFIGEAVRRFYNASVDNGWTDVRASHETQIAMKVRQPGTQFVY